GADYPVARRPRPPAAPAQFPRRLATSALPAANVPGLAVPRAVGLPARPGPGPDGPRDARPLPRRRRDARRSHDAAWVLVRGARPSGVVAVGVRPAARLALRPAAASPSDAVADAVVLAGARPEAGRAAAVRRPGAERLAGDPLAQCWHGQPRRHLDAATDA